MHEKKTLEDYVKCSRCFIYAVVVLIFSFSTLCICFSKFSTIIMYYSYNYKRIQNKNTGVYIRARRASNSLLSIGSTTRERGKDGRKEGREGGREGGIFSPGIYKLFLVEKNYIPQVAMNM